MARKTVQQEILEADKLARYIVADDGLNVPIGDEPTAYQSGIAAIHGRQDAAANMALITSALKRLERLQWWMGFNTVILVIIFFKLS